MTNRGDVSIGAGASIRNGANVICIQGSKHLINDTCDGHIQIGCHKHTLEWWLEHGREVGPGEGYTPRQIEEYRIWLEAIQKVKSLLAEAENRSDRRAAQVSDA